MKALDTLRRLLRGEEEGAAAPTSAEVSAARTEIGARIAASRKELKELERARPELLVVGTEDDLKTHDERVATLERRLEQDELRAAKLSRRLEGLREEEEVRALPGMVTRLQAAAAEHTRAQAELDSAKGRLRNAATRLAGAWRNHGHRYPEELAPIRMPNGLAERVEAVLGQSYSLPRSGPEAPKNEPVRQRTGRRPISAAERFIRDGPLNR